MRVQHLLKHNRTVSYPTEMVFFDTETVPDKDKAGVETHRLRLGVATYLRIREPAERDYQETLQFKSKGRFFTWLVTKPRKHSHIWCFAHNLMYDMMVLDGIVQMRLRGYSIKRIILADVPNVIEFTNGDSVIMFCDSLNYFPFSLEKVGESVGLAKLPMPKFSDSDSIWNTYCRRDVDVLQKAILQLISFLRDNDLGSFRLSGASIALNCFRHRFMTDNIYIHNNPKATQLERECYYGGRVECFRVGEYHGTFYNLDVNSMYPSVMLNSQFPTNLIGYKVSPHMDEIALWSRDYLMCAECRLKTTVNAYPYRYQGRLCFPVGQGVFTLPSPEFLYALSRGDVLSVSKVSIYEHANIFSRYVTELYKMRLRFKADGNKVWDELTKRLLNMLYGKFGQLGEEWRKIGYYPDTPTGYYREINGETGKISEYRSLDGYIELKVGRSESYNSFPAISACVTSYARLKLYGLIQKAGRGNCYYCDSDSLIVNERGYNRLRDYINPTELGYLKVVGIADSLTLYGAKDYIFGTKVVHKGIRNKAIEVKPNTYEQQTFRGFKAAWREQEIDRAKVYPLIKECCRAYTKGLVNAKGIVSPYVLNE